MEKNQASKKCQDENYMWEQIVSSPVVPKKPWTWQSVVVLGVSGCVIANSACHLVRYLYPVLSGKCMPFQRATKTQMSNIMKALEGRTGTVLDLGSGDGRVVIEASRHGFMSHGVELHYSLVLYSRYNAWMEGLEEFAEFQKQNLWKTDLSKYDNIYIFGVNQVISNLEPKLEEEIKPTSYVLTSGFPLPNWTPVKIIGEGLDTVWVYKHPAHQDS